MLRHSLFVFCFVGFLAPLSGQEAGSLGTTGGAEGYEGGGIGFGGGDEGFGGGDEGLAAGGDEDFDAGGEGFGNATIKNDSVQTQGSNEDTATPEKRPIPRRNRGARRNELNVVVTNPFHLSDKEKEQIGGGYGMMGEMDMEMEDMGMDEGDMMMEGMMGGGMSSTPSPDDLFRAGLQKAILALKSTKSTTKKAVLLGYVRRAFQDRYEESIASRRSELEKIKLRVAQLESDLKRRESAKERVVEVQLQSVQLAAEGLMELNN